MGRIRVAILLEQTVFGATGQHNDPRHLPDIGQSLRIPEHLGNRTGHLDTGTEAVGHGNGEDLDFCVAEAVEDFEVYQGGVPVDIAVVLPAAEVARARFPWR